MPVNPATGEYTDYYSQAARDVQASVARNGEATHVGGMTTAYAKYIERSSLEHCAYFVARGDLDNAQRMLTQSLSQSLMGNDGD